MAADNTQQNGVQEYQIPASAGAAPLPPAPPTPPSSSPSTPPLTPPVSIPIPSPMTVGAPTPSPAILPTPAVAPSVPLAPTTTSPVGGVPPVMPPPPPLVPQPMVDPDASVPPEQRKQLETKAKQVINEWDNQQKQNPPADNGGKKKTPWVPITVVGLVSLSAIGLGLWGGLRLLNTPDSAEVGSEAGFKPDPGVVICNENDPAKKFKIKVEAVSENPVCPNNNRQMQVCPVETVNTTSYAVTYNLSLVDADGGGNNPVDSVDLTYVKRSDWCTEKCGKTYDSSIGPQEGVCWDNNRDETVNLTLGMGQSETITITRASDNGQACGSYQTDVLLNAATNCPELTSQKLLSFSLCYTGTDCAGTEPSPTPDASPTPGSSLSCNQISMNPTTATIGSTVTFTCAGQPTENAHAVFQYSKDNAAFTPITNATTTTATLTVNAAGAYAARCRWCLGEGETNCTPWQESATQ